MNIQESYEDVGVSIDLKDSLFTSLPESEQNHAREMAQLLFVPFLKKLSTQIMGAVVSGPLVQVYFALMNEKLNEVNAQMLMLLDSAQTNEDIERVTLEFFQKRAQDADSDQPSGLSAFEDFINEMDM